MLVDTYSSLKSCASFEASFNTFCMLEERLGSEAAPETLGSLSMTWRALETNCSVGTPIFCSNGTIMPSLSSTNAMSRWIGNTSGWPFSLASELAF